MSNLNKAIFAFISMCVAAVVLVACGGGGGSGGSSLSGLAPMIDSLGRTVPESDFGGGQADAAGADGSAGDGRPIVNATVTLKDNAGNSVTATTDAQGYYRVKVKGFTPPFVATVVRTDGSVWVSPSIAPVKVRGFVTVNLTGLSDKVASDVAVAAGFGGVSAQLTPASLAQASNQAALVTAKANLNTQLANQISSAGLNTATFDPVTTAYKAVTTDNYDKLLESVVVTKDPATGKTVVASGSIVGTWYALRQGGVAPSFGTPTTVMFTFFANGDYMQSQAVVSGASSSPGLEHGTYTWNQTTGALAMRCPAVDTNGQAGVSSSSGVPCTAGSTTLSGIADVSGNSLTIGTNTFTRLKDVNPIVGTWYNARVAGVPPSFGTPTTLTFTFFANGDYMQSQAVVSGANVTPGIEFGTYTWNSTTGALAIACPTVDTNAQAGVSHPGGVQCVSGTTTLAGIATLSGNTITFGNTTFDRLGP